MLARLSLFCRACLYVSLHAAGISAIAQRHYLAAIVAGAVINYLWASNVRAVVPSDRLDRLCYSAGGATGMLVGLLVGQLLASFA